MAISPLRRLDDETITAIAHAYRQGVPTQHAAAIAGVTPRSLQRWVADGQAELDRLAENPAAEPDPHERITKCVALVTALKTAESRFVEEQLLLISRAARSQKTTRTKTFTDAEGAEVQEVTVTEGGSWQAAAWLLERRNNTDFGRQVRQVVSGPDGGPIVTREQRADRLAEWLEQILDADPAPDELTTPPVEIESRAAHAD